MPFSESWLVSSMKRNSLVIAGEKHCIFWFCGCTYHELLWWWWLYIEADSIMPIDGVAGVPAAAVALLSSFLNLIPHALHSDCNSIQHKMLYFMLVFGMHIVIYICRVFLPLGLVDRSSKAVWRWCHSLHIYEQEENHCWSCCYYWYLHVLPLFETEYCCTV